MFRGSSVKTNKIKHIKSNIVAGTLLHRLNLKFYRKLKKTNQHLAQVLYQPCKNLSKTIDFILAHATRYMISITKKTNPKTIMFLTYQGDYTCNPRAIAEELISRNVKYKMYWVYNKFSNIDSFPKELTMVERGSYEFYRIAAETKLFVDNTHNLIRLGVHKKKSQILLQTWHGSLGLKRLDGSVVMGRRWKRIAAKTMKLTDYIISNSAFENMVYRTSYWKTTPLLLYGHPRNDILFSSVDTLQYIRKSVLTKLGLPAESKILLYAPTHRDGMDDNRYHLNYSQIQSALEHRFGGDWVILVKLHSRLRSITTGNDLEFPPFVVDVTDYEDIQELMVATDVGITDYSSWIFDFMLLRRPGFIFAFDLAQYIESRSFYYPIDTIPFPIATTNDGLSNVILNFDENQYYQKLEEFLIEKGCVDDGYASMRVVDKISKLLD